MAEGFVKLYRCIIESDIYQMSPLYLRVFERLILEANHKEKTIPYKDKESNMLTTKLIKRGERLTSLRQIAEWVSWYERGQLKTPNVKTIKLILDWLENQKMISIYNEGNRKETHYKVLNYEIYQSKEDDESNARETPEKHSADINKNVKNEKNEKNNIYAPDSEQEIVSYWNQKEIVVHSKITNNLRIALTRAIKLYPLGGIKTAIDHYATMYNDQTYEYCQYKWTLEKFLDDVKGITYFMDDGQKWINYQDNGRRKTSTQKTMPHDETGKNARVY